jgi:hypothetical protein
MKGQQTALSWLGLILLERPSGATAGQVNARGALNYRLSPRACRPGPLRNPTTVYFDFGGAADRGKTKGGDGIDRASPCRPKPSDPTISRAPRP